MLRKLRGEESELLWTLREKKRKVEKIPSPGSILDPTPRQLPSSSRIVTNSSGSHINSLYMLVFTLHGPNLLSSIACCLKYSHSIVLWPSWAQLLQQWPPIWEAKIAHCAHHTWECLVLSSHVTSICWKKSGWFQSFTVRSQASSTLIYGIWGSSY